MLYNQRDWSLSDNDLREVNLSEFPFLISEGISN